MSKTKDNTGFKELGFRPVGQMIALLLDNDDLLALASPKADKKKKSEIIQPVDNTPKLFKGDVADAASKEAAKNDRTFTVAAISKSLVDKDDCPEIGDEVSLMSGVMNEVVIGGQVYGCVPLHRILGVHKDKIAPILD